MFCNNSEGPAIMTGTPKFTFIGKPSNINGVPSIWLSYATPPRLTERLGFETTFQLMYNFLIKLGKPFGLPGFS